jgi:hypothetical protein
MVNEASGTTARAGEGLFTPDALIRRVDGEAALRIGTGVARRTLAALPDSVRRVA